MASTKFYVVVGADQVVVGTGNDVIIYQETSSQSAYLSGGISSSQAAFTEGYTEPHSDTPAFLEGTFDYRRYVDEQVVDIALNDLVDGSSNLIVASFELFCTNRSAYTEGYVSGTPADSSISAYLTGPVQVSSSKTAYLEGTDPHSNISAYLYGVERTSAPAFVRGAIGKFAKTIKLTINSSQVAETTTDFPVLVKLWGVNDTQSELATVANGGFIQNTTTGGASGSVVVPADLVFALDKFNEDVLDFEIEYWNPVTGQIHAWMRMADFSSTVDTEIYINFGDSGTIISQENIIRVWLDNYEGVYHLAEASGTRYDSTINNHHGTPVSSPPNIVNNALYKGVDLGADGDYINIPWNEDFDVPNAFTLETWLKSDITNYTTFGFAVDFGGYDSGFGIFGSSTRMYGYYNGQFQISDIAINSASFYIYGLTYDGTTVRFIRDYSVRGSDLVSPGTIPNNPFRIGAASDADQEYFDGWEDEVRLSSKHRTAAYFETNHRMIWQYYQSSAWMTIGAVEDVTQRDSIPAFLEGFTEGVSTRPAYLSGVAQPKSSVSAYMSGGINVTSDISAYLRGPSIADSSISAYLAGPTPASSSIHAFLDSDIVNRSSISAWLWADWPTANSLVGSQDAFLEGDGTFPFSDDYTGTNGEKWNNLKWDTDKRT